MSDTNENFPDPEAATTPAVPAAPQPNGEASEKAPVAEAPTTTMPDMSTPAPAENAPMPTEAAPTESAPAELTAVQRVEEVDLVDVEAAMLEAAGYSAEAAGVSAQDALADSGLARDPGGSQLGLYAWDLERLPDLGQQAQQSVLGQVHVLIFIDRDPLKAIVHRAPNLG